MLICGRVFEGPGEGVGDGFNVGKVNVGKISELFSELDAAEDEEFDVGRKMGFGAGERVAEPLCGDG